MSKNYTPGCTHKTTFQVFSGKERVLFQHPWREKKLQNVTQGIDDNTSDMQKCHLNFFIFSYLVTGLYIPWYTLGNG